MTHRWVFGFHQGDPGRRDLLGGKGAGLAEMTRLGLPVPPGFTITTEACNEFLRGGQRLPDGLWEQVLEAVRALETEKRFGDPGRPLLLSVRSGAKFSMPGMMDTVLNLGLNRATARGLARLTGSTRFAMDSLRRLIQLYGRIVLGVKSEAFDHALRDVCAAAHAADETELSDGQLEALGESYRRIIETETRDSFPEEPEEQLRRSISAVFQSWNGRRARDYRRVNHIPDDLGTAVNVQTMVFGNMGTDCGTGVAFTRNPATGEPGVFGEFLVNAQGEDVVAGIRTPLPISRLEAELPAVYGQFLAIARKLERHFCDMQDVEFTIERGRLYMLQTRTGKRTGAAAVRMAVDMAGEGLISTDEAVLRVDPASLDQLLHPRIDPKAAGESLAQGLPASPGAASGEIVLDPDEAEAEARKGRKVLLVRTETAPEDFHGMVAATGILTSRGGMTSHAAVVARGMGKCCVCGAADVHVDLRAGTVTIRGRVFRAGDWLTIDGSTGRIYAGKVPTLEVGLSDDFQKLMTWADGVRSIRVRANADTPDGARDGRRFGAEGIGLCRTEHMFFEGDRILAMREMILAETEPERRAALAKIEPLQRKDFLEMFRALDGFPVTIRTLDPPLHEFLPLDPAGIVAVAKDLGVTEAVVKSRVGSLHEANPMLGLRGCRLGLLYPEITEMQARAIFGAAVQAKREGVKVFPEVMIPLVSDVAELRVQAALVRGVAKEVMDAAGVTVEYLLGTMIELPRAALLADEIAGEAEFFSFGTNDLTQTTYGLSRDDAGKFLPTYVENKWFAKDPFQVLDQRGVGKLMRLAIEGGRATRPKIELGICGEHGGEPESVKFCVRLGLDYVSCSPYRVPIARLAAAQAALEISREAAFGSPAAARAADSTL